jgi:hypothetical protein
MTLSTEGATLVSALRALVRLTKPIHDLTVVAISFRLFEALRPAI